ncbi:hypothetical protein ES708_33248 [subsurface metagenome]
MIKSISFKKEFIPLIKQSKKTVTRRIKTNLKAEDICYFKIGKIGKKQGYLKICNIIMVRLRDIRGDIRELEKEGFYENYPKCLNRFIDLWYLINKKNYRWQDNPYVYRIKFEYLGESLNDI